MMPAMRSAVSTAERMQCSARSRWVIRATAFEAFGAVMAEAEHLELNPVAGDFEPVGRGPGSRDQAADLARANVERCHDALALATIETDCRIPPAPISGISLGA